MWALTRTYLFSFVIVLLSCFGFSQTYVPDDNFEQALINLGYDTPPLDDNVPTTNINSITNLNIDGLNISDLTGIEDFLALEMLSCQSNTLTTLNISQNVNLSQLFCGNNQLTGVDVSQNPNLIIFWCESNQINNLDISQNTNLISLVCGNNRLSRLDVSQNTRLNVLLCENNQISSLNVSQNVTLTRLQCDANFINNINLTNNIDLSIFTCENNDLTRLDLSANTFLSRLNCAFNNIGELDVSNNVRLTELNCSHNNLCRLNLRNGNNANVIAMNFGFNPDLNCVIVDNPAANHSTWQPLSFSNYVASLNDCSNFVNIDMLDDVVTSTSYTLPFLVYGDYYSESGGLGVSLSAGDIITSSQTIYIYNETACDTNESSFNVLIINGNYYIPKFFTPNNDGYNDIWQVYDTTNSIRMVNIFDRYGKLLKTLIPSAPGWDGNFNGQLLNTDDYWYTITLNSGEIIRGHFTLKR